MKKDWFVFPLRVRYQETDQMGVVYHANYVNWFEVGRTEWVRAFGYPYTALEEQGLLIPVVELQVNYKFPARYDDVIVICTRIAEVSPLRLTFESQVRRLNTEKVEAAYYSIDQLPGELLVSGGTKHVWVDKQLNPVRLSRKLPELYEKLKQQMEQGGERMKQAKQYWWIALILLPVIEIWSIVQMSDWIGGFNTLLVLIGTSLIGAYAAKQEGRKVLYEARTQMNSGQIPGYSLVNGACVLLGGILLLIPGFISDIFGILLLIPFTRVWFQAFILKWLEKAMRSGNFIIRRF